MDLQVIRARECSFTLLTAILLISCINERNTKHRQPEHVASDKLSMLLSKWQTPKSDYGIFLEKGYTGCADSQFDEV